MLEWLAANLANLVVLALLAVVVVLVIRSMIRNRKAGKSACGCDCGSCPSACTCGRATKQ